MGLPLPFAPSRATVTTMPAWLPLAVVAGFVAPFAILAMSRGLLTSLPGLLGYLGSLALIPLVLVLLGRRRVRRVGDRARAQRVETESLMPEVLARLAPGTKDARTWQASLDEVLNAPATYRSSAVDSEHLWRIVEDPTQPLALRGGAAVALRKELDEAGMLRLRVAAASSASHGLKRVVDAAAPGGDEEDLAAALEGLSVKAMRVR